MTATITRPARVEASAPPRIPLRYRIPWKKIMLYLLALGFAAFFIAPFYWIVATSFMHEADAVSVPPQWIPQHPTLDNYLSFLDPSRAEFASRAVENLPRAMANSAIVATLTALCNLLLGVLAAYTFARIPFRGSKVLLMVYLATRMVPGVTIIVPFYLLMRALHLLDTYLALILSYTTFALPFTIWILKDYFRTIPRELEDAARVDRCTWPQMMRQVFLPIATPGLVTVTIFSFLSAWNEFMFALFLTSTIETQTMPIIVANFATDINVQYTVMAAAGVLAVIPPLVIVMAFQRLIVRGLAAGSVKG
ncbi:carbohydrate ABC transporter permease [Microlunatus speluncae]|uniref:carbohydrate ABC transporter permease n=1 Tax=Microlunatus speluncae TaxID=2594267 RepID=UPI0012666554|nr:carbohydrate ABC transporter permease [Microlunatus speluncae]